MLGLARASALAARSAASTAPRLSRLAGSATVADAQVTCVFVFKKQQQRITVPGMVGWTLLETAEHHNLPLRGCRAQEPWNYSTFGEGPGSVEDHVVVAQEFYDKCGPMSEQELELIEVSEGFPTPTSRLAACITLTKELDGISVIVPETNVDYTNYG
jgi:ferredoxin